MFLGEQAPLRGVRWSWILACVVIALAVGIAGNQLKLLPADVILLIVACGAAAFLARRSVLDAAFYIAALLLCVPWVEPVAAPRLLACFSLAFLAMTGRPRFALFAGGSLFGLLLFSVAMKYRYSGSVLTWQDVRYFLQQFSDNIGVMASQPTLVAYSGVALLVAVAAGAAAWRLDRLRHAERRRGFIAGPHLVRALSLVLLVWCAVALDDAAAAQSLKYTWRVWERSAETPVSTFLSTLHLEPKVDYRQVDTAPFAREVASLRDHAPGAARPADVVVFLQESQINPAAVGACPPSLCAFEVFGAPKGTRDHGELRVHTYGAGTWLAEFALATGVPHRLYGPAGEFAPFNVAPGVRRSFVRSLKAAGYYTVAVYPTRGGMMNGRTAYGYYGFDEFYDSNDLGLPGGFATPDSRMHEAALKVLASARGHGKPVFLMVLTIFNHGEHGVGMQRVPGELVTAAHGVLHSDADGDSLADYVWRTREFESTFRQTRQAVLGADRPVVLAWFGDHQPAFANAPELREAIASSAAGSSVPNRFLTWYNISTNTGQAPGDADARRVDIVFLAGLLAQRAGVPLDDWLAANVLARERCGGLFFECRDPQWRDSYLNYVLGDLQSIRLR
jgi:hypothetical protein